jgi:hypothetical protein
MPFAGYANFAQCLAENQDRDNPEAYCAAIMRQVEGGKESVLVSAELKYDKDGLVEGYANTPIVDRGDAQYRDYIPAELWMGALVTFFGRKAPINVLHRNIEGGETVRVDVTANGPLLVTRPTKEWVAKAIEAGDLSAYSIEYVRTGERIIPPGTDEYRALLNDPLEYRAIRYYKGLDLLRVSYVDEPMNQGSYFLGGKVLDLSSYEFSFDREQGVVTIFARTDEAMAELAGMLSDGLKATRLEAPQKGIAFKVDTQEMDGRRGGLLARFVAALSKETTDEEDPVNKDLQALVEGLTSDMAGMKVKVEALEKPGDGVKVEDLAALKTAFEKFSTDLLAALPKPEAKTLAERVTALSDAQGEKVVALEAEVSDLKATVESLVAALEKGAKSSVRMPQGSPGAGDHDPWGPNGKGSKLYDK